MITDPATPCLENAVADADADGRKLLRIVSVSVSFPVAGIMTKAKLTPDQ